MLGIEAVTIDHFYANGSTFFDDDFLHIGIGKYIATGELYLGDNRRRYLRGTANRIKAAIKIMTRD